MRMQEISTRIIPTTPYGFKFAEEFEKKLRSQNCFVERKDSTNSIQITAEYFWDIKEDEDETRR